MSAPDYINPASVFAFINESLIWIRRRNTLFRHPMNFSLMKNSSEGARFELARQLTPSSGLANRRTRPLCDPSKINYIISFQPEYNAQAIFSQNFKARVSPNLFNKPAEEILSGISVIYFESVLEDIIRVFCAAERNIAIQII